MTSYRLCLLGHPYLEGPGGPLWLQSSKPDALVCYLAAQPQRMVPRPQLLSLFWEGYPDANGRHILSTTLTRLRQLLPPGTVLTASDAISWRAGTQIETDISWFDSWAGAGADLASLTAAVGLWRGTFLEGITMADSEGFDAWLQQERQLWERRMLETLARLTELEAGLGRWQNVLEHSRRALAMDPLQERFHRFLMKASYQSGDRAAALSQYEACRKLLRDELGVPPHPATLALRDEIVAGLALDEQEQATLGTDQRTAQPQTPTPAPIAGPAAAPPAAVPAADPTPLAGRQAELVRLRRALAQATAGERPVVFLQGEAGIGKSRLVNELLRGQPTQASATVLLGECYEGVQNLPYGAFIAALRQAVQQVDLARLDLPELWLAEVGRLLPEIAHLRPGLPSPPVLDLRQEQHRLFAGVAAFLAALPPPVLLVLEDLHWAGEESLLLLAYLAHQTSLRGRVAMLVTVRSPDMPSGMAALRDQLQRRRLLTCLDLQGLSPQELSGLAATVAGWTDPDLGHRLYAETHGNPLFALELVRCLSESTDLPQPDASRLEQVPLSGEIRAVVHERWRRLDPAARAILAAAAIFPNGVANSLLQYVAETADEPALAALEVLFRTGLLQEWRSRTFADAWPVDPRLGEPGAPPRISYTHNLFRRAVYGSLSQTRLQVLHRRAFMGLKQAAGSAAQPAGDTAPDVTAVAEQLAHHATAAGMWEHGLQYSMLAASHAKKVLAYPAAARLLEQALFCLERLPATPEHQATALEIRRRLPLVPHSST